MLWIIIIIPFLATATSLALALPTKPYSTNSSSVSSHPPPNAGEYDISAGDNTASKSTVVTLLTTTTAITSTFPVSQITNTTSQTPAAEEGSGVVVYVTATVTDPIVHTVTTSADSAVETVFETVTIDVPAKTQYVVVMLITSIETVIQLTATRTMTGTGSVHLPPPGLKRPLDRRQIIQSGTKTLAPFTKVDPVPPPPGSTTCTGLCVEPLSNPFSQSAPSTDKSSVTTTHGELSHTSTTTITVIATAVAPTTVPPSPAALGPVISTVYQTVRPTTVTTVTEALHYTITTFVTVTTTATAGTTTFSSTSGIVYTLTDYAVLGIYGTGGAAVTSVVTNTLGSVAGLQS